MRGIATAPLRRAWLGAEELLELGQAPRAPAAPNMPAAPFPAPSPAATAAQTVSLSREEGQLIVHVAENIVAFAKSFPIEFNSYCPQDRWQKALIQAGTWSHEIQRQLDAKAQMVSVPAEAVFRLMDLEKCVSAARDARLDAAKLAFGFSAAGAIADLVFGITWLGIPAYVAGLAILFGRPLIAKYRPEPQEPYKPSISGRRGPALGAGCRPPEETEEERSKAKLLERVILPPGRGQRKFYWGRVDSAGGGPEGSVCLAKGRSRVRVEGWVGDVVVPAEGWSLSEDCLEALNVVGIWDAALGPRQTPHGPLWEKSRHKESYWVEYVGPNTGGRIRRAGPFG